MPENWHNWCRLCAKRDWATSVISHKIEMIRDQLEIVNRCLMISLHLFDGVQLNICEECSSFLTKIDGFVNNCTKVDQMFQELVLTRNISDEDLQTIRYKYGIDKKDIKFTTHLSQESKTVQKTEDPLDLELDFDFEEEVIVKKEKKDIDVLTSAKKRGRPRRSTRIQLPKNTKKKIKLKDLDDKSILESDSDQHSKESQDYEPNQSDDTLHHEDTVHEKKRQKQLESGKKEHICEICCKKFCRSNVLKDHIIAQHRKEELPYVCSICSKRFLTAYKLKLHEDTHRPDDERRIHPCSYCGKKFAKIVQVQAHINAIHIRNKPYICEECGKGFGTKGALVEHQISHTEDRPYQCSYCPKKFKNRIQVKNHEEIHKDPIYACPHCDQKFRTRLILRMHMVVHSDAKQYKCNYCGNEYKRAKTLKNHLILHTGLRPYQCPFCDKTFSNGSNCRSHKKKAHPVELAALEASGKITKTTTPKLEHLQPKQTAPLI